MNFCQSIMAYRQRVSLSNGFEIFTAHSMGQASSVIRGATISRSKTQDTGHRTQDTGHRTQDTGHRTQDKGHRSHGGLKEH
jgi:hypothetical protein